MSDYNKQPVRDMLSQVRARLIDLEEAIDNYPGDMTGYDKRLDRIDDRIYLLEAELEKRTAAINRGEEVPPPNQTKVQAQATKAGNTAASVADKAMDAASKAAATAASAVTSFTGALSSSLNENNGQAQTGAQPASGTEGQNLSESEKVPSPHPTGTTDPTGDPNAATGGAANDDAAGAAVSGTAPGAGSDQATSARDEQMRSTVRDLNVIYQQGRDTLGDLTDAINDIKEPFDKLSSAIPHRRRW